MGNALCCFNPIYGESMSAAALEAKLLDSCLRKQVKREKAGTMYKWTPRFQKSLAKVVRVPWELATREDFHCKEVPGKRPFITHLLKAKQSEIVKA